MKRVTALVTGVGAPGGVTIMKALRNSSLSVNLVTTDVNPHSVGLFFSDKAYLLPHVSDATYLDRLINLCREEKIDIAFVGSEPELRFLIPHFESVEKETGTVFVISRPELMTACMDKWEMTQLLVKRGFHCPESALASDKEGVSALLNKFGFPLFIKPRAASGSRGAVLVHNPEELAFFCQHVTDAIVQEWLPETDEEYTVGVYTNRNGNVVGSIVSRRELAAGLTYRAFFGTYPEIADYCERVADALKPLGPCNFQLRRHRQGLYIFEINPRCSSTTVMRAVLGFNEPEMAIRDLVFHEHLEKPMVKEGIVLRYWDEAYISDTVLDLPFDGYGKLNNIPTATVYPLMIPKTAKEKRLK